MLLTGHVWKNFVNWDWFGFLVEEKETIKFYTSVMKEPMSNLRRRLEIIVKRVLEIPSACQGKYCTFESWKH